MDPHLQTMAVLRRVRAIHASELIDVGVRFHMRVEHRLVNARVGAFDALEGLRAVVIAVVILQMMLVFGDKIAVPTIQLFLWWNVSASVRPAVVLKMIQLFSSKNFTFLLLKTTDADTACI